MGRVFVLICALDYKGTSCPLTCSFDGNNMQELLKKCDNVAEVRLLYDNEATSANAEAAIRELGSMCGPEDYFMFYYSGHGSSVPDKDGDEEDGKDEALCFVGPGGKLASQYFMIDDDFARIVTDSFQPGTNILILTDCCHSGTIGDFEKPCWDGFPAISLSGCMDAQTSGDMGKGGIFTHSMLLAIDKLDNHGRVEYSVGDLYKATVKEDDAVFRSQQIITINASRGGHPDEMRWPLLPSDYVAPLNGAISTITGGGGGGEGGGFDLSDGSVVQQIIQGLLANPAILQQFNISPAIVSAMANGVKNLMASRASRQFGIKEEDAQKLLDGAEKYVKMGAGLLGRWLRG
ncbi:unnamed protein product [Polarella glacialis]|uniref:Peptidase C14 caspase domain-containing protein n=1 Tax=Polarella glacialis TaxID=89957 RepID=A0A813GNV1_POLGL|nr:unnamed protein product [Polarella glacialis]|mmetsp:Transcript_10981/g.17522  ORF Transcript_10981/g.17522 Transcript_10981/m.17522 type:complete len:348 (-) Transcript_10981:69-1112(-)